MPGKASSRFPLTVTENLPYISTKLREKNEIMMKRLLVGDLREELLSTLEVILKHWGYRVVLSSRPQQLADFLRETSPDLLIMGAQLLAENGTLLMPEVTAKVTTEARPLIVLSDQGQAPPPEVPHEMLEVPVDVFALFTLIQKHIENYPRKNLRLTVKLPGMFCTGETCFLAEVLSLSTQGLFIKTGARLAQSDQLKVIFPLMGMKKELELDSRVLYRVEPGPENNYLQGVGIEFTPMDAEAEQALKRFIECCFLGELSASQRGGEGLDPEHLRNVAPELTLRLIRSH